MNNTTTPKKRPNYAPEVRQRAVRMVLDHQGDYPSRWGYGASALNYFLSNALHCN